MKNLLKIGCMAFVVLCCVGLLYSPSIQKEVSAGVLDSKATFVAAMMERFPYLNEADVAKYVEELDPRLMEINCANPQLRGYLFWAWEYTENYESCEDAVIWVEFDCLARAIICSWNDEELVFCFEGARIGCELSCTEEECAEIPDSAPPCPECP